MLGDLQNRGVQDILIASVDGLAGSEEAILAVFPRMRIQRCVTHGIRSSLKYVSWKDRKAFTADLKAIYRASTREEAEANLARLGETWGGPYAICYRGALLGAECGIPWRGRAFPSFSTTLRRSGA